MDPRAPYLLQKYFNHIRKLWKQFINIVFGKIGASRFSTCCESSASCLEEISKAAAVLAFDKDA